MKHADPRLIRSVPTLPGVAPVTSIACNDRTADGALVFGHTAYPKSISLPTARLGVRCGLADSGVASRSMAVW
jgi:hypothetical protein